MFAKDLTRSATNGGDVHEMHIDVVLIGCIATSASGADILSCQRLGCGTVSLLSPKIGWSREI